MPVGTAVGLDPAHRLDHHRRHARDDEHDEADVEGLPVERVAAE
jgi:hypothetical protein